MPPVHGGDLQLKPKLANDKQSSLRPLDGGCGTYTINDMFRSASSYDICNAYNAKPTVEFSTSRSTL